MKIVKTKDGSNTILHESLNEHYHSIHGAVQESRHVFIQYGLGLIEKPTKICVFEMGFGTGLNALLAYEFAIQHGIQIDYYTIEAYPITANDAKNLAYDSLIDDTSVFVKLHEAEWNKTISISPQFNLHKIENLIEEADLSFLPPIDVIFYDAFAPNAQAHLWEEAILLKLFMLLQVGGHLSTYCAKGQFKRNLKAVGFEVKGVPGPPGKREMTLAYKRNTYLQASSRASTSV